MNLKELINEVEKLKELQDEGMMTPYGVGRLQGIKQTVEAVDSTNPYFAWESEKDWQKLKKLLGLK